jgi:hypothetical protein
LTFGANSDTGNVESRTGGMKLPAEKGPDTHGGVGAAAGIGIEDGTWSRTVREKLSSMVGSLWVELVSVSECAHGGGNNRNISMGKPPISVAQRHFIC